MKCKHHVCQQEFTPKRPTQKYCSNRCKKRVCVQCKQIYPPTRRNQIYCSKGCVYASRRIYASRKEKSRVLAKRHYDMWRKRTPKRNCLVCLALYSPTLKNQRFCSKSCSNKYRYKNNESWRKKLLNNFLYSGRFRDKDTGYIWVYAPSHPKASNRGFVYEHRVTAEKYIGRYLKNSEVVHHINGIRDDNRIENLQVIVAGEHSRFHARQISSGA